MEIFSNNEIADSIYLLIKNKSTKDMTEIIEQIISLDRKRISGNAEFLLNHLKKVIYKQEGILEVNLFSAIPLDTHQKKEIITELKRRYNATDIVLTEIIDTSLLGGFKIEINNQIIDLTIRNKIIKLQEYLIKQI
jgi:F-type H+-transporting ATPase subunit delta